MNKTFRARGVHAVDGDTLKLPNRSGRSSFVRLAGFNAPELHQFGGLRAKQKLERIVNGRTLTFHPVGRSYGRIVAVVPYVRGKLH